MSLKIEMVRYLIQLISTFIFLLISGGLLANDIEGRFLKAGLVDLKLVDDSILVDLVNSDPSKNFFETNFYNGLNKAYLRKEIAIKLSKAQGILKKKFPEYSLLVMDAARPRSVSHAMYEQVKGTRFERYVANPDKGSMHNYGIALDLTIVDGEGDKLDMGPTPFYKSRLDIYWQYLLIKIGFGISAEQQRNRDLLSNVMQKAGFYPLSHEWWHFNGMKKKNARSIYSIIE